MEKKEVKERYFNVARLFGEVVLFTYDRVDKSTIPPDLYVYEISHEPYNFQKPIKLGKHSDLDYYGAVVCKKEIKFYRKNSDGHAYRLLKSDKDLYITYNMSSISKYLNSTKEPTKRKEAEREER